jgi:hypothetical protein
MNDIKPHFCRTILLSHRARTIAHRLHAVLSRCFLPVRYHHGGGVPVTSNP